MMMTLICFDKVNRLNAIRINEVIAYRNKYKERRKFFLSLLFSYSMFVYLSRPILLCC